MNLTRYDKDGLEIFIAPSGEAYASIRGYARMSGLTPKAIRKRIGVLEGHTGGDQKLTISATIPTPGGLQEGTLITEDLIARWLLDDNPQLAKDMLRLGVRATLYQMVGYKIRVEKPQPQSTMEFLDYMTELIEVTKDAERRRLAAEEEAKTERQQKKIMKEQRDDALISYADLKVMHPEDPEADISLTDYGKILSGYKDLRKTPAGGPRKIREYLQEKDWLYQRPTL